MLNLYMINCGVLTLENYSSVYTLSYTTTTFLRVLIIGYPCATFGYTVFNKLTCPPFYHSETKIGLKITVIKVG